MTLNGRERGLRMHPMMFFAVLAAYFVKGLSGFANSLVFGSIMNFFTTNLNIVPVDLLLGTPSNLILALHSRREIRWKTALILAAFMTVGTLPGVFLLKNGDDRMLKIVLGILILCLGVEMLTRDRRKAPRERKRWVTWALAALAGMLMGTFGIGAVMVVCVERLTDNPRAMRGTLCTVFLADNVIRTIMYAATGVLTAEVALTALKLLPMMILGLLGGMTLAGRLPDKTVRRIIIVMLMLMGASLALTNLL